MAEYSEQEVVTLTSWFPALASDPNFKITSALIFASLEPPGGAGGGAAHERAARKAFVGLRMWSFTAFIVTFAGANEKAQPHF
jgi:hypothetical protein